MLAYCVAHCCARRLGCSANGLSVTALHHAAESGSFEPIQALIEAGADLEAKTQAGFTPAMLARIAWVFADEERPEQVQNLLRVQAQ